MSRANMEYGIASALPTSLGLCRWPAHTHAHTHTQSRNATTNWNKRMFKEVAKTQTIALIQGVTLANERMCHSYRCEVTSKRVMILG